MSVSGLCEICDRPSVEHTCDRCGKLVCERHWDEDLGVCVQCAGQLEGDSGEPLPDDADPVDPSDGPDGVDTYEF